MGQNSWNCPVLSSFSFFCAISASRPFSTVFLSIFLFNLLSHLLSPNCLLLPTCYCIVLSSVISFRCQSSCHLCLSLPSLAFFLPHLTHFSLYVNSDIFFARPSSKVSSFIPWWIGVRFGLKEKFFVQKPIFGLSFAWLLFWFLTSTLEIKTGTWRTFSSTLKKGHAVVLSHNAMTHFSSVLRNCLYSF